MTRVPSTDESALGGRGQGREREPTTTTRKDDLEAARYRSARNRENYLGYCPSCESTLSGTITLFLGA